MAFALLGNVQKNGSSLGGTTSAVDTTGADLIVLHISQNGGGGGTPSDSKGNTWTALTTKSSTSETRIYYCKNPTVGTGHTFTVAVSGLYGSTQVAWFSGADTSAPFDVENGATSASASSLATGSITPGQNDSLIIAGLTNGVAGTNSINASFTITNQQAYVGGTTFGGAMAYLIQTTASAVNPTWTLGGTSAVAATIAAFKPAAGGGGGGLFVNPLSGRGGAAARPLRY